jgi:hypothetical protein
MPSLLPRILSWGRLLLAGWWSPVVACVTLVLCLCRSCRGQATFGETAVGGILSSSPDSGSPRWSRQPAVSAAGPLARAGLPYLTPWRLLGHQPAGRATLGIPPKSSPRHRGLWLLVKVKHGISMRQVNPNKVSKEKTTIICSHIIKTTHDSFKGTLNYLSHLRQVMLQQKLLSILSK